MLPMFQSHINMYAGDIHIFTIDLMSNTCISLQLEKMKNIAVPLHKDPDSRLYIEA